MERTTQQAINTVLYLHCISKGMSANQADREINKGTDPELYKKIKANYDNPIAKKIYDDMLKELEDGKYFGTGLPVMVTNKLYDNAWQAALRALEVKAGFTMNYDAIQKYAKATKKQACDLEGFEIYSSWDPQYYKIDHEDENKVYFAHYDYLTIPDEYPARLNKVGCKEQPVLFKKVNFYTWNHNATGNLKKSRLNYYYAYMNELLEKEGGACNVGDYGFQTSYENNPDYIKDFMKFCDEEVGYKIRAIVSDAGRKIQDAVRKHEIELANSGTSYGTYFITKGEAEAEKNKAKLAFRQAGFETSIIYDLMDYAGYKVFKKPGDHNDYMGTPEDEKAEFGWSNKQLARFGKEYKKEVLDFIEKDSNWTLDGIYENAVQKLIETKAPKAAKLWETLRNSKVSHDVHFNMKTMTAYMDTYNYLGLAKMVLEAPDLFDLDKVSDRGRELYLNLKDMESLEDVYDSMIKILETL